MQSCSGSALLQHAQAVRRYQVYGRMWMHPQTCARAFRASFGACPKTDPYQAASV